MTPISHTGQLPWVQLRNALFHPSIFQKMVGRVDPKAKNGDLVAVYDRDGQQFGTGMLSTQSQIGLRMLTFDAKPADESLIADRLAAAVALRRESLKLDEVTTAYRVVHAEGDGLPGLIVDRFDQYAVVELFSFPMYRRLDVLKDELRRRLGVKDVLVRADARVQAAEGFVMAEDAPAGPQAQRSADRKSTTVTENGVRFQIDLTHGHKTGFFCDQRDNRLALTEFTPGAQVLDLCSYSGGFGVYAATRGKAAGVLCVDLDEDAIALAQRNANLNKVPRSTLQTVHSDAFPYLRQAHSTGKSFDVVVLDPPKLIPTREDAEEGRTKYFDLNRLALNVVKPGGTFVTCSCSGLLSPEEFFNVVRGAARGARRRVQVLRTTGAGEDHPVMTDCPESAYLKCLWCRVW
jgi:23S rRNA (cytosine1962-C5)-methyltransferase